MRKSAQICVDSAKIIKNKRTDRRVTMVGKWAQCCILDLIKMECRCVVMTVMSGFYINGRAKLGASTSIPIYIYLFVVEMTN